MKLSKLSVLLSCAAMAFAVGCSGGGHPTPVTDDDGDSVVSADIDQGTPPAPWTNVQFTTAVVEPTTPSKPRGDLGSLVRAPDGTLYYTYQANEGAAGATCDGLAIVSGTTSAPGQDLQVHVAVQAAGASSFGTPETLPVGSIGGGAPDFVGGRVGLDSSVMPNGHLLVATPGGKNGQFTCAVANLLLGERTGANAYTMTRATTGSSDYAGSTLNCSPQQHETDLSCCDTGQNACGQGTDSGYYPSIAWDGANMHIAYQDNHFVTDNDGKSHGDFEVYNAGSYSGIDMWSGYGYFSTLRYRSDGVGLVVTAASLTGDIQLFRTKTAHDNTQWEIVDGFTDGSAILGRPRMEIAPDGTIGIAYYQTTDGRGNAQHKAILCEYLASDTELTLPNCESPENATLVAGQDVSLAYDSQSRPVLAYYYCGGGTCVHDGLRVAWRDGNLTDGSGHWWRFNAHNVDNDKSGNSASVVVDPSTGEPTVVFQDLTTGAAMVAYGKFN